MGRAWLTGSAWAAVTAAANGIITRGVLLDIAKVRDVPWLHDREVALIGADTPQDVQPSGYEDVLMPVHAVSLVAMGLWLLDNWGLEACARTAAELGQREWLGQ